MATLKTHNVAGEFPKALDPGKHSQGTPVRDNLSDDLAAMAHWIGRKCNIHDPLRTRVKKGRGVSLPRVAFACGTERKKVIYSIADGRRFEITVRELEGKELEIETEEFVHG